MTDYLGTLAARSLDMAEVIQPRRASAFEPAPAAEGPVLAPPVDLQEDRNAGETSWDAPLGTPAVFGTMALEIAAASAATPARPHHRSAAPNEPTEQAPNTPAGRPAAEGREPLHGPPTPLPRSVQTSVAQPASMLKELALPARGRSAEPETADGALSPRAGEPSRQALLQPVDSPAESTLRSARPAAPTARALDEQPYRAPLLRYPAEPKPTPPRRPSTPVTEAVRPQPPLKPLALAPVPQRLSAPVVNVTIGRIEVRAVTPAAPPPKRTAPPAAKLALEDYLKQREEGRR